MSRVIHFEILAESPEKISSFYQDVLGWKVDGWDGSSERYWLVTTGPDGKPGINGGIMDKHFGQSVINTIEVESLSDTLAKVEQAGGKLLHGPNEIPGVGTHAYCTDPEGALFGIMQPPAAAGA